MTLTDQARALTIPHADQPVDTAELRDRLEAVTRLCWEMAEVVARLPKTKDGKSMHPRMIVWWISKDGTDLRECQVSDFWDWPRDPDDFTEVGPTCWEVNNRGIGRCGVDCYSTREAALAARPSSEVGGG